MMDITWHPMCEFDANVDCEEALFWCTSNYPILADYCAESGVIHDREFRGMPMGRFWRSNAWRSAGETMQLTHFALLNAP
jgi:hypothetical protein